MVIGPALGGHLTEIGLQAPFHVAAAFSAPSVAAIWFFLPESLAPAKRRSFKLARPNPVGAFAAIAGDAILRRLVVAALIFTIATQVFPVIWPICTVEAFGFTPVLTGVSYTILGLTMAASQGLLVMELVAAIGEVRTVRYATLCGIATLSALVLVSDGGMVFLAMIPLISVAFVVAPTIQGMMSQRMGEGRQG